ncbi:MAG: hypothetical protein ACX93P_15325 [Roseovarius sp.]
MITRRNFLTGAGALAVTPVLDRVASHYARTHEPLMLRPDTIERVFYVHPEPLGLRLITDALEFPRAVVHASAIEEKLGAGTFNHLTQRDHWRLIEDGYFGGDDIYVPAPATAALYVWDDNYSPHAEAFHLLHDYGLGPEGTRAMSSGLTFYEYPADNPAVGIGVFADDWLAVSLLQAKFVELGIPVQILRQERGWIKFLQDRDIGMPVTPENYFGGSARRQRYTGRHWGQVTHRVV